MLRKTQTALTVILILLSALLWAVKPVQAMRRESDPARPVAVAEVRVILIGKGW